MRAFPLPALAAAGLLLAACASAPATEIVNANSEGVAVAFDGSREELARAVDLARDACGRAGRMAVLTGTSDVAGGKVASFDCRRP